MSGRQYQTSFTLDSEKSDTVDLADDKRPAAIYVGAGGDLNLELFKDADGSATLFKSVPTGTVLELRVRRIHTTGTTATLLVGLR